MTRKITFLIALSLVFSVLVLASGVRRGAAARVGRMGALPVTTQGNSTCDAPITINEVRYLGKYNGSDDVRVLWTVGGGCLSAFGSFYVTVRLIRKHGHVDIGYKTHQLAGAQQNTQVTVSRGVAETDPEKYEVTITGQASGNSTTDAAPREATLAEASGAGKTFPVAQSAATCGVTITVTSISYKGRISGNDRVEVKGNVSSTCFKPTQTNVGVSVVTQAAGQPEKGSTVSKHVSHSQLGDTGPFNASFSETFDVGPTPGASADPIIRFKTHVSSFGSATRPVFGSKFGNF